jgi:hypothetical protein
LLVAVVVCVCPAVTLGGIWGRTRIWHRKAWCGVRIPLPEHTSLMILLRQGGEGGLDDVVLVEVRSVDIGDSFLRA